MFGRDWPFSQVYVIKNDRHNKRKDMDDDSNYEFLPFFVIHKQAPVKVIKISLVYIFVEYQENQT